MYSMGCGASRKRDHTDWRRHQLQGVGDIAPTRGGADLRGVNARVVLGRQAFFSLVHEVRQADLGCLIAYPAEIGSSHQTRTHESSHYRHWMQTPALLADCEWLLADRFC
jgi:hypothetical protein